MELQFKNFGPLISGNLRFEKPLTVITGKNSSGKSYATYVLFSILDTLGNTPNSLVDEFDDAAIEFVSNLIGDKQKGTTKNFVTKFKDFIKNSLSSRLLTNKDYIFRHDISGKIDIHNIELEVFNEKPFGKRTLRFIAKKDANPFSGVIEITKDGDLNFDIVKKDIALKRHITDRIIFQAIKDIILKDFEVLYFPPDRGTLNAFSETLVNNDFRKFIINMDSPEVRDEKRGSLKYTMPVLDYLKLRNQLFDINLSDKSIVPDSKITSTIIDGGKFNVDDFGEISFSVNQETIPYHLMSSSLKSLSLFFLYFEYRARKNNIIFIDEPEINLHPENQVLLTRLLVDALNKDIKIIISTHSDYIIRELNLILLNSEKSRNGKFSGLSDYNNITLTHDNISVYEFKNHTIDAIEVTPDGFSIEGIDDTIKKQNSILQQLIFEDE